jgi:hypothetical protein
VNQQLDRFRNLSRSSRAVFWVIIAAFVAFILYAIFSSRLGQTALLICCGGIVLVAIVGIISEQGMRRR